MTQARIEHEEFPFDAFAKIVGGHNWVIARRTPNILARYGQDVVCLTPKSYQNAERLAWLSLSDGLD